MTSVSEAVVASLTHSKPHPVQEKLTDLRFWMANWNLHELEQRVQNSRCVCYAQTHGVFIGIIFSLSLSRVFSWRSPPPMQSASRPRQGPVSQEIQFFSESLFWMTQHTLHAMTAFQFIQAICFISVWKHRHLPQCPLLHRVTHDTLLISTHSIAWILYFKLL